MRNPLVTTPDQGCKIPRETESGFFEDARPAAARCGFHKHHDHYRRPRQRRKSQQSLRIWRSYRQDRRGSPSRFEVRRSREIILTPRTRLLRTRLVGTTGQTRVRAFARTHGSFLIVSVGFLQESCSKETRARVFVQARALSYTTLGTVCCPTLAVLAILTLILLYMTFFLWRPM